jgi:hypothetical protein
MDTTSDTALPDEQALPDSDGREEPPEEIGPPPEPPWPELASSQSIRLLLAQTPVTTNIPAASGMVVLLRTHVAETGLDLEAAAMWVESNGGYADTAYMPYHHSSEIDDRYRQPLHPHPFFAVPAGALLAPGDD